VRYNQKLFYITVIFFTLTTAVIFMNAKSINNRKNVFYQSIEKGTLAQLKNERPIIKIFCTKKDFEDFYKTIHLHTLPSPHPPEIDFETNCVIFISLGMQKTAGYTIELRRVYQKNAAIIVEVFLAKPAASSLQAQVITNPYVLLMLTKRKWKSVELRSEKGENLGFVSLN